MPESRLATHVWVDGYRKILQAADIMCFVVHKGDAVAGGILVKLNTLNGQAQIFERQYDLQEDIYRWIMSAQGDEVAIDQRIKKSKSSDCDLWVLEVESASGQNFLDLMP